MSESSLLTYTRRRRQLIQDNPDATDQAITEQSRSEFKIATRSREPDLRRGRRRSEWTDVQPIALIRPPQ